MPHKKWTIVSSVSGDTKMHFWFYANARRIANRMNWRFYLLGPHHYYTEYEVYTVKRINDV